MKTNLNIRRAAVVLTAGAMAIGGLGGCGDEERVCVGDKENMFVIGFSSTSDLTTAQALAPQVADVAAARAAHSCGLVGAAVATNRVESDLVVHTEDLEPARTTAPNRKPHVRRMLRDAESFYEEKLLTPLKKATPTNGSPFLGALAKLGSEVEAQGYAGGEVIGLVGDGIAVEESPSGKAIDFRQRQVDQEALGEFVPLLKPLAGSCVALLGAGAESNAESEILRRSRQHLKGLLRKAAISFVATRTAQLPARCKAKP